MIRFRVPGVPVPMPRARARVVYDHDLAHARIYTPSKAQRYKRDVWAAFLAATNGGRAIPFGSPIAVTLAFGLPVPPSYTKRRRAACLAGTIYPTGRPDVDNLAKSCLDALSGPSGAWGDDTQVVELYVTKRYAAPEHVGVVVTIAPADAETPDPSLSEEVPAT